MLYCQEVWPRHWSLSVCPYYRLSFLSVGLDPSQVRIIGFLSCLEVWILASNACLYVSIISFLSFLEVWILASNACLHRKKRFTSFPSPAGMSLTELPQGRNNSVMTSLFPPRKSLVVTSQLGTETREPFFMVCMSLL
jgi:hypothetical protein